MISMLLIAPVLAQDCDARALEKALETASPNATATAFTALAACDGPRARKNASSAFQRVLSGSDANDAVIAAIEVDAGDTARTWISDLQSDERSSAIAALGHACSTSNAVAGWLVETPQALGEQFWSERWYRSLAECRVEGIQTFLSHEVDNPSDDQARFSGVLEVYARNLGINAIPRLGALASELDNAQEIGLVINAFGDAAGLGSLEGANPEALALAVKTLVELAPELPTKIVDQIRTVLIALGAQEASNNLAGVRFDGLRHADGNLHYGLVAVATHGCKKGAVLQVHTSEIVQPGTLWPDQLETSVRSAIDQDWDMSPGKKCTVEGELEVFLSRAPLPDAAAVETFHASTTEEFAQRGVSKHKLTAHEALVLP